MSDMYERINGEDVVTYRGLAILHGVTEAEFLALPMVNGFRQIPAEWAAHRKRLIRKTGEMLGTDDLVTVLDWIEKMDRHL